MSSVLSEELWAGRWTGDSISGGDAGEDRDVHVCERSCPPPQTPSLSSFPFSTTRPLPHSSRVTRRGSPSGLLNSQCTASNGGQHSLKEKQLVPPLRLLPSSGLCIRVTQALWPLTPKLPVAMCHRQGARGKVRARCHTGDLDSSRTWPSVTQSLARKQRHESVCLLMPEGPGIPTLAFITCFSLKCVTSLTLDTVP